MTIPSPTTYPPDVQAALKRLLRLQIGAPTSEVYGRYEHAGTQLGCDRALVAEFFVSLVAKIAS